MLRSEGAIAMPSLGAPELILLLVPLAIFFFYVRKGYKSGSNRPKGVPPRGPSQSIPQLPSSPPVSRPQQQSQTFVSVASESVAPHGTVVRRQSREAGVWADGRVVWEGPSEVRGSGSGATRRWSRDDRRGW